MILVTLGTQDKQFPRLLQAVDRAIEEGAIQEEVVVQAGFTKYESSRMKVFDFIEQERFAGFLEQANLLITHGGVGTIMTALREGKKILGAARLVQYGEHQSDHQGQVLEAFDDAGYLIYMKDLSDIRPYLKRAETFSPKPYVSNNANMIRLIEGWIEQN
jgi:UDP-N-acetylglucosamine transferase subunit ALG13